MECESARASARLAFTTSCDSSRHLCIACHIMSTIAVGGPHVDQITKPGAVVEALTSERINLVGLALVVAAVWMLRHPYAGIVHDAQIYTLLALARLHPHLSGDVFLRYGSQDQYTLFSPLYAEAIRHLDLGPAAAALTFASEVGFFACAYLFLRRCMPAHLALLGVGLLAALSTDYGANLVFHCTEDFLTPRLPAEALVLGGLAASLSSRRALGVICIVLAMVLHPIIGSAGAALLLYDRVARHRFGVAVGLGLCATLVSLSVLMEVHGGFLLRFDEAWLQATRESSNFLFPTTWSLRDWSRASVPVAVLLSGVLTTPSETVRRLSIASLVLAVGGVLLTLLYCDLLHVVFLTGTQLWRWLWLATVISIGLAPLIARDCWNGSPGMRAVPLVLAAAWLLRGEPASLGLSLLAVTCAVWELRHTDPRAGKVVWFGSMSVLAAAGFVYVVEASSYHEINTYTGSTATIIAHLLYDRTHDGVIYAVFLALWLHLSRRVTATRRATVLAGVALLLCAAAASAVWQSWTTVYYSERLAARFAEWRRQIPVDAEVMWSETPVDTWYLLDRRSYFSGAQVPGPTFSREKTIEVRRRLNHVADSLAEDTATPATLTTDRKRFPNPTYADRANAHQLALMCRDPALAFSVSWSDVMRSPFEPVVPDPDKPRNRLHLYSCATIRSDISLQAADPITAQPVKLREHRP